MAYDTELLVKFSMCLKGKFPFKVVIKHLNVILRACRTLFKALHFRETDNA